MRDPDDQSSNPSANPELASMIEARMSRRAVLGGGLGAATIGFLGGSSVLGRPVAATPSASVPAT
ncbi:MAG: hypothetical protein H0U21_17335, partial [Acidimicrobiia bacterium]|nr:hypothetical protein [Acidimicrobiia bacterium]